MFKMLFYYLKFAKIDFSLWMIGMDLIQENTIRLEPYVAASKEKCLKSLLPYRLQMKYQINNRFAFDSEIFLPNANKNDENHRKDYNFKIAYHIKPDYEKTQLKRITSKIPKLDENNQYSFGMTKLLPTGCIKT